MADGRPGRPKGLPKSGGRKPGTPNKNRQELSQIFEERFGRSAFEELCDRYDYHVKAGNEPNADVMLREIVDRIHPKLRAVEHSAKDGEGQGLIVSVQRVDLEERKKQLKGRGDAEA